jgi:hypothetical protein
MDDRDVKPENVSLELEHYGTWMVLHVVKNGSGKPEGAVSTREPVASIAAARMCIAELLAERYASVTAEVLNGAGEVLSEFDGSAWKHHYAPASPDPGASCQHPTMAVVCGDCGAAWAKASSARPDEAAAVLTLMHLASRDTDAVSMFSFGESVHNAEAGVAVLRGPELVACFRDWAEAQGVFTRGKPVEGPAPVTPFRTLRCTKSPGATARWEFDDGKLVARIDDDGDLLVHAEGWRLCIRGAEVLRFLSAHWATAAAVPIALALAETQSERDLLEARVAVLEAKLDTETHWWPLTTGEAERGWVVVTGEEEPGGHFAVFSDEDEAKAYLEWRTTHEAAKLDDDRDPSWESAQVLPAEYRARFWNSIDECPVANTCEHGDHPATDGQRFCSDACRDCEHGQSLCAPCTVDHRRGATSVDALQSVLVAVCAHLSSEGACSNADKDSEDSLCDNENCTYCALERAVDALPEEMKP